MLSDRLTDGVEFYRSLGAVTFGPSRIIGLENCRSLEVVLVAVDELDPGCGVGLRGPELIAHPLAGGLVHRLRKKRRADQAAAEWR